ncbi:uncharacterized protein LOC135922172 [Gordionus sp. m RMFG-2023]|uniref:uncharacterized protein LOC135922172 n=1 Tax=Gordionus sp. m RMFG-2023 TaxID=3053472 RepID=UPI0031FCFA46
MKIQTVAENIDNLLKLRKLKIKKTIKNKDYIEYLGYQYLLHKSGKSAIYYYCRKRCGGRAKLFIYCDFSITKNHSETCKPIQNALPLSTNIILEQLSSNFQDDSQKAGHSQEQSLTLPNQGDTQSQSAYTSPLCSYIS